jgi:hypothetical protein
MPVISRFSGIVIFMNYNDHPPPHFHARQGGDEVVVYVEVSRIHGTMSVRALRMVLDWTDQNREALLDDWNLARERKPLKPIPPLE